MFIIHPPIGGELPSGNLSIKRHNQDMKLRLRFSGKSQENESNRS